MNQIQYLSELMNGFVKAVKEGHVFFYDSETDEVVHFRQEIYRAAQNRDEPYLSKLSAEEGCDGEDARLIVSDEVERFLGMPDPSPETKQRWVANFTQVQRMAPSIIYDWELFRAERFSELLMEWLQGIGPKCQDRKMPGMV